MTSPANSSHTRTKLPLESEAESVDAVVESSSFTQRWINQGVRWFLRLSRSSQVAAGIGAIAILLTFISILLQLISFTVKLALVALAVVLVYRWFTEGRSPKV